MPADLKKVARELQDLFDSLDYHNSDIDLPAIEFILQTLVSEVRAQAMEEAGSMCIHEGDREMLFRQAVAIRRRASGKEE
jgi:hypothetical protein